LPKTIIDTERLQVVEEYALNDHGDDAYNGAVVGSIEKTTNSLSVEQSGSSAYANNSIYIVSAFDPYVYVAELGNGVRECL